MSRPCAVMGSSGKGVFVSPSALRAQKDGERSADRRMTRRRDAGDVRDLIEIASPEERLVG